MDSRFFRWKSSQKNQFTPFTTSSTCHTQRMRRFQRSEPYSLWTRPSWPTYVYDSWKACMYIFWINFNGFDLFLSLSSDFYVKIYLTCFIRCFFLSFFFYDRKQQQESPAFFIRRLNIIFFNSFYGRHHYDLNYKKLFISYFFHLIMRIATQNGKKR